MKEITVLGIGNILLQDEGFGVKVVQELQNRYRFPDHVKVLDGGTLGMELVRFIADSAYLLILDAINGSSIPGTLYRFAGDQVTAYFQNKVSLHELGVKDVLATLQLLDKPVEEVVIIGVEPASLELGLELTPIVAAVLDSAVEAAVEQLKLWQVEVKDNV